MVVFWVLGFWFWGGFGLLGFISVLRFWFTSGVLGLVVGTILVWVLVWLGFVFLVFDFRLEFGGLVLGLGGLVGFGALGCLYNFL